MKLPYTASKADPSKAQKRIREILQKFGVSRVGFEDDFMNCTLTVRFIYKEYPVSLPIDYGKLAEIYYESDPWTSRKYKSQDEWHRGKREIAYKAAFSLLEDFIKSIVTIVEIGVFSFEEIFISYFTNAAGERLGEKMLKILPEYVSGKLALGGGK